MNKQQALSEATTYDYRIPFPNRIEKDDSMLFSQVAATEGNPGWDKLIARQEPLYSRRDDIRTEFCRDYNRILHSSAYRRLKHKTQVFFAPRNDHICTRIEHVNHVAAVSYSICKRLGLNTELATAIAIGHDLGHAPFGHHGETILKNLVNGSSTDSFWHEKNSLWFVDSIETLPGPDGSEHNLNLTYAVRDGIVCHCGEVDANSIFPREEYTDLESISEPSQYEPYTWEGCVVKIADKISFLGRDIEDARDLGILSWQLQRSLVRAVRGALGHDIGIRDVNNTFLMHRFMIDLCKSSSPEVGLTFSKEYLALMTSVKQFSADYIYSHPRLEVFKKYVEVILHSIYDMLRGLWRGSNTLERVRSVSSRYPLTAQHFVDWLIKYSNVEHQTGANNRLLYDITVERQYEKAVIDYISGMTDSFAIRTFNEIITF